MKNKLHDEILAITEQCVKCGMCLPHCPTYKLNNLEGQSPRGRIALWQNLIQSKLEYTPKTKEYLNQCLSCGSCTNNCPAGVEYPKLVDLGKNYLLENNISANNSKINTSRILITIFSSELLTNICHFIIYCYQKLRLHFITKIILYPIPSLKKSINDLYNTLPNLSFPKIFKSSYNTKYKTNINKLEITDVIIFTGCVNKLAAPGKIKNIIKILNTIGINVYTAKSAHCCGALQKHNGLLKQYNQTSKNNLNTVSNLIAKHPNISHILSLDTGCHTTIEDNFISNKKLKIINSEKFIFDLLKNNQQLIARVKSLAKANIDQDSIIYYYTPCSQREQINLPNISIDLLKLIFAKSTVRPIPEGYGCCGAAGNYMIEQPDIASKLANKIISELLELAPQIKDINNIKAKNIFFCTSNIGCALHLSKILKQQYNLNIEIISPLEIFGD
jgi:glycolate oxidase iron-sulfur subunit